MDDRPFNSTNDDQTTIRTAYRFSPEEMQIMARCNRESFYQRSLPIATMLGLGTYWCVKSGYFKPHPQWGATWKVTGAVIVGYFLGKLSYQQRCAEYFMAHPDSHVGEVLRKRRAEKYGGSGSFQESDRSFGVPSLPSFGGFPSSSDVYSDLTDEHRYTDLDTHRPLNDGLNDSYRPSVDYPALEEEIIPPASPGTTVTYEELRKRNREEYANRNAKPIKPPPSDGPSSSSLYPGSPPPPPPSPPQYSEDRRFTPSDNRQKNVYGDVWDK